MSSATYDLFRQAILHQKQVTCVYAGFYREVCPHVIGSSKGAEKVLCFQFGGESKSGLPPGGNWRCLSLDRVTDVRLRDGTWHAGDSHMAEQTCVEQIDIDVNVDVRRLRKPARR